jgi:hypothetical protein
LEIPDEVVEKGAKGEGKEAEASNPTPGIQPCSFSAAEENP